MKLCGLLISLALIGGPSPLLAQANTSHDGAPQQIAANEQVNTGESLEDIAKDAARDQQNRHYYNKPGATFADYNRDWQICRLIGNGTIASGPQGPSPYFVTNGLVGGLTATLLGGIVDSISAHAEGNAKRHSCLLIKGWRFVKVPDIEIKRLAAMSATEREAYRRGLTGAEQVIGEVEQRTSFTQPTDPVLNFNTSLTEPASLAFGKNDDRKLPIQLKDGEGGVIVAFRRSDKISIGKTGQIWLRRYDFQRREISELTPKLKNKSETPTYYRGFFSESKNSQYEVHIVKFTEGDYVISKFVTGPSTVEIGYFCMGSPFFHVTAGKFIYLGDFTPYGSVQLNNGMWFDGLLAWSSHIDDARSALANSHPEVAGAMQMADIKNGATYRCSEEHLDILELPGVPSLAPPLATQEFRN